MLEKKGHGVVDLRGAIIQSCDTYFYEMSRRLGVDRLKVTASRFGLGNKVFLTIYIGRKKEDYFHLQVGKKQILVKVGC